MTPGEIVSQLDLHVAPDNLRIRRALEESWLAITMLQRAHIVDDDRTAEPLEILQGIGSRWHLERPTVGYYPDEQLTQVGGLRMPAHVVTAVAGMALERCAAGIFVATSQLESARAWAYLTGSIAGVAADAKARARSSGLDRLKQAMPKVGGL